MAKRRVGNEWVEETPPAQPKPKAKVKKVKKDGRNYCVGDTAEGNADSIRDFSFGHGHSWAYLRRSNASSQIDGPFLA